jgi:integrative and conjugative element protein (TIGR02256 family)
MALDQLRELCAVSHGAIEMPVEPTVTDMDGWVRAQISLDCTGAPRSADGLRLRRRERFQLLIARGFPFDIPVVFVQHLRWAGTPHVQWGYQICLYAAPSIEWVPADGMFGLIQRLTLWLERAALGELDPDDQPLHPPVAYTSGGNGVAVVRADLGGRAPVAAKSNRSLGAASVEPREATRPADYRLLVGITEVRNSDRFDLVEWVTRHEWLRRFTAGELPAVRDGHGIAGVLAVLTDREMSFEYPNEASELVSALETIGVPRDEVFRAIGEIAAINYELARQRTQGESIDATDFNLLVGTPSRRLADGGGLRQHLVCWRFDRVGRLIAENIVFDGAKNDTLAHLGELAKSLLPEWIASTQISWVRVMEARSEVTIRRDVNSASEWLRGRRVLILGCGALGAPIAEFCVRAEAADIHAIDNDVVTPGILVRQPYSDEDIGLPKALALATRLNKIRVDQPVRPAVGSAQNVILGEGAPPPDFDLVIDATADSAVAALLEFRRARTQGGWPPVVSVMIGHDARRGIATISKPDSTGAGRDILRKLALAARAEHAHLLDDLAADFFPDEPPTTTFQPEPGCSSPTFTGSAADLAALAGHLIDAALRGLACNGPSETAAPMTAAVVRLDESSPGRTRPGLMWFGWPADHICHDPDSGYEIRINQTALTQMRTEVRRGARLRGPTIETGGLLLGQVDDACRCIWVDNVSGPPPDSLLSAVHFDHGLEGVEALIAYHRKRSGKLTSFLGMWHSHPNGAAEPSPTDTAAMATLVTPIANGPRRALVVIVGGHAARWRAWVDACESPDMYGKFVSRATQRGPVQAPPVPVSHRSSAWPGGWRTRAQVTRPARKRFPRLRLSQIRRAR